MVIYKYTLSRQQLTVLQVPHHSMFLSVQLQGEEVCIWLTVFAKEPIVSRSYEILLTGIDYENTPRSYLGTVQQNGIVMHVFERL